LQHQKIAVISTHDKIKRIAEWPQTVELVNDRNEGLDFGLWWRYLEKNRKQLEEEYDSILLVNDSCEAITSFNDMWERMNIYDFWGITDSYEGSHHIQSYWLAFNSKTAVKNFWKFFDTCKSIVGVSKSELVGRREIAISLHMVEKGHKITVAYPFHILNNPKKIGNISFFMHYELKALGCPLIKNARERQTRVIQAKYGTIKRSMDVSEIVAQQWGKSQGFVVKSEVMGCDPALNCKKTLTIQWIDMEGKEKRTILDENTIATPWI
jgi:hypothetical protein